MNPWLLAAGGVVGIALLTRKSAPASTSATVPVARNPLLINRNIGARLSAAGRSLAVDGAFGARVTESATTLATGYRGGTSPPRIRSCLGSGMATVRGRSDGLPLGMASVQVPWAPGRAGGGLYIDNPDRAPIATLAGIRDAFRWSTDVGYNDADRAWAPGLIFDGDDVGWIYDFGPWQDDFRIGGGDFLSVGFDRITAIALDAEHQLTGRTEAWSAAAWELDAPRVMLVDGKWKLQGFGAAQLEEGQRLSATLGREWSMRVNGYAGNDGTRNPPLDGTTGRVVWAPLLEAMKRSPLARTMESGWTQAGGDKTWDILIGTR